MFSFIKRPLYALSNRIRRKYLPVELMKEKWVADFSKTERSCFDIKPEISYNAKLEKGSLLLGLKKKHCMAWVETADRVYVDQVIDARFRFNRPGGYCAAGIMFRIMEKGTYYLALVSSKGYFRLDVVNSKVPRPLVGWTEAPGIGREKAKSDRIALGIVARGSHLVFTVNGRWVAEADDASIPGGHLGFAMVSYSSKTADSYLDALQAATLSDSQPKSAEAQPNAPPPGDGYVCQAWLDHLSVDARPGSVAKEYVKWTEGSEVNAESRLCLAETFVALDRFDAAYDQILKAWNQRENAARSVTATYTDMRTGKELLFAARLALHLGRHETAEKYIDICLSSDTRNMADSADEMEVLAEKAKVLSALGTPDKFRELVAFLPDYIQKLEAETGAAGMPPVPPLYALLGHAWWSLGNHEAAAAAWDMAFALDKDNGLYAENAADAYDALEMKDEALRCLLAGGSCLLRQADLEKLGSLVPKLLAAGSKSREAHILALNWANATGDSDQALALTAKLDRLADNDAREPALAKKGPAEVAETIAEQPDLPNESQEKPAKTKKAVASKAKAEPAEKKPAAKAGTKTKAPASAEKTAAKAGTKAKAPTSAEKTAAKAGTKAKAPASAEKAAAKAKAKPAEKPGKGKKAPEASAAEKAKPKTPAKKATAKAPAKPAKAEKAPAKTRAKAAAPKPAAKTDAKQGGSGKKPAAKPKTGEKPAPKAKKPTK